eukprot:TRINITY_DN45217_c0_g1_i1.p1 TRINITY_DN45217_c0_g1~~TRINITY_DN45217_c0_g1_i1.p1  ORF type:complete len:372 (+),score=58.25 TRINITY_DN45217_c0_g1_i1:172-1287(+)
MDVSVDACAFGKRSSADLHEFISHWTRYERLTFSATCSGGCQEGACSKSFGQKTRMSRSDTGVRRFAIQLLHRLLLSVDAVEELPGASMLFDALSARLRSSKSRKIGDAYCGGLSLASPVTLAALCRIALKTSSKRIDTALLCDRRLLDQLLAAGVPDVCEDEESISVAEFSIVQTLQFRTKVIAPREWAESILVRLKFGSSAGADAINSALERSPLSVVVFATLLTERVPATVDLLPKALGMGACFLGLVTAGVLIPDEAWPRHYSENILHEATRALNYVVTWVAEAIGKSGVHSEPHISRTVVTMEELAEAACEPVAELQEAALQVVLALLSCISSHARRSSSSLGVSPEGIPSGLGEVGAALQFTAVH